MAHTVVARIGLMMAHAPGHPRLQRPDAWTTIYAAMEFGFSLPGRGPLAGAETILKLATKAESLRFSSLFVTDHVVLPASMARSTYPYSTTGQLPGGAAQDYLEPLVTMGWLARVTSRIRLDEYLRLMRAAWTTDPVTFEGRYYSVRAVHALPKPAQRRGIPIWIGGHTDAAVRRAATLGDAWHPIALRPPGLLFPDAYAKRAKQLSEWAQAAGRGPKAVELTVRVPMEVRPKSAKAPAGDRPLFQGTAAEVIADIRAYQAAGVTHFVFDPTVPELKAALTNMERFAHDVRGKVMKAPK
jgi:alkanesulfonate monooxygenase SsuD/methylene tetrahydromethanopterin reductase-like flavin-dependent oxidoreductase (luciferase family)